MAARAFAVAHGCVGCVDEAELRRAVSPRGRARLSGDDVRSAGQHISAMVAAAGRVVESRRRSLAFVSVADECAIRIRSVSLARSGGMASGCKFSELRHPEE